MVGRLRDEGGHELGAVELRHLELTQIGLGQLLEVLDAPHAHLLQLLKEVLEAVRLERAHKGGGGVEVGAGAQEEGVDAVSLGPRCL